MTEGFTVRRFFTGRRSAMDARLHEHLFFFLLGLPQMFFHLLWRRPCVLFPVFAFPSGLMAVVLSKVLRVPSFVFVDAADTPGVDSEMKGLVKYLGFLLRFVSRYSMGVVILDGLQDLATPYMRNQNVTVIPNGTPLKLRHAPLQAGEVVQFLSIGRLVLRKGFSDIIEALAILKAERSDFHLTIVGYGKKKDEIETLLDARGLNGMVTMVGRVEYAELERYYLASHAYLFYGNREGSSLAMIEAVSYGLPVLASDHPGNRAYVKDGYNGFLVSYGDPLALAARMRHLLEKREAIRELGAHSVAMAETFSWKSIAARYLEFFGLGKP
ncbi:glycosyl transferase, group 1 [Hylemonella gracilis ATCC 19624]|uniref:Glycosyl transferase, group 1 n=2 Tax=Hylemonella gracilis TaxID=80880 RepID=F3KSD4_9BURK|nr:glycosyl transferase, group 1 [Hylemonella gracilis ATCC 19624]